MSIIETAEDLKHIQRLLKARHVKAAAQAVALLVAQAEEEEAAHEAWLEEREMERLEEAHWPAVRQMATGMELPF
jgi:hypothetical protein